MVNIYNKFSFIVALMVLILFFNMAFGDRPTKYFLLLILLGMVLTNSEQIAGLFTKTLTYKE